jgi:hypothetical protein
MRDGESNGPIVLLYAAPVNTPNCSNFEPAFSLMRRWFPVGIRPRAPGCFADEAPSNWVQSLDTHLQVFR